MISGIDLTQVVDYKLESDTENPTIWKLGVLPSDVFSRISADSAKDGEIETAYKLLGVSIRGWENFPVVFRVEQITICGRKISSVPADILGQIPMKAIGELTKKCLELNGLTVAEQKN